MPTFETVRITCQEETMAIEFPILVALLIPFIQQTGIHQGVHLQKEPIPLVAIQTDWSEGAGQPGPVITWERRFDFGDLNGTATPGRLTLPISILDGRPGVSWNKIHWNAALPGSTGLSVEIRASDFPSDLGPWITVGASGDPVSSYVDPNARYLQYRLNLNSGNPDLSALFKKIRVTRNR